MTRKNIPVIAGMGVIIFLFVLVASYSPDTHENELFLIPEGYEGPIALLFEHPKGEPKIYEDGRRKYVIPKNGILKTRFSFNEGIFKAGDKQFFYLNNEGTRTTIEFIPFRPTFNTDEGRQKMRDDGEMVYVFAAGVGVVGGEAGVGYATQGLGYKGYVVGKLNTLDDLYSKFRAQREERYKHSK